MARAAAILKPVVGVIDSLRSSFEELRKVTWPSREQTLKYTVIVIVSVLIATALTAAIDYGLSQLLERLIAWSQRV